MLTVAELARQPGRDRVNAAEAGPAVFYYMGDMRPGNRISPVSARPGPRY